MCVRRQSLSFLLTQIWFTGGLSDIFRSQKLLEDGELNSKTFQQFIRHNSGTRLNNEYVSYLAQHFGLAGNEFSVFTLPTTLTLFTFAFLASRSVCLRTGLGKDRGFRRPSEHFHYQFRVPPGRISDRFWRFWRSHQFIEYNSQILSQGR